MKYLLLLLIACQVQAIEYKEFRKKSHASLTVHLYKSCIQRLQVVEHYTKVEAVKDCTAFYYTKDIVCLAKDANKNDK